jgi:demethylmenaquinone methyltransferase/2-methoxy-6-polyprenyl-1,4-benzoquinol methylase
MNPKYFRQVQQNYDRLSSFYDLLSGKAELAIFRRAIDLLRPRKIESLLDIGCGTGKGLFEFRKSKSNVTLLAGIDISFEMCRKASIKDNEITTANGLGLPFKSSAFEAMVYSFSLEIIPEDFIRTALDECLRVLKPGGVACIISMSDMPNKSLVSDLYSWAHKTFPKVVDCRPISVFQLLDENRFMIIEKEIRNLFGLPVEIVLAEKK